MEGKTENRLANLTALRAHVKPLPWESTLTIFFISFFFESLLYYDYCFTIKTNSYALRKTNLKRKKITNLLTEF